MTSQAHKINGVSLTAMVVTTAIGSGIFALSSDLAVAASDDDILGDRWVRNFNVSVLFK